MKLLSRTIKNYFLYSLLLVVCCTPLFYFSISFLFLRGIDSELEGHRKDFLKAVPYLKSPANIDFYRLMNEEFLIRPIEKLPDHESLLTIEYYDSTVSKVVPHRVLTTGVLIGGVPYELQIRESLVNDNGLVLAIMSIQLLLLALLLAGLFFINRQLARTIWKPFYTILDRLKKYQIDRDTTLDLPASSTAEFRDLSQAITQLVDKNHQAYLSQKEFTENASHELQTPLAISLSKLELLAQTQELTQEQAELVGNLLESFERITRLSKNLLLLSKIENRQFFDADEMSLSAAVQKLILAYERLAGEKRIFIKKEMEEEVMITANPALVDVLISNLVSNAIRHAPTNSTVTISVKPAQITISNEGSPLSAPEKIFDRFHRESKHTMGSGLGLAIVKKICEINDYEIEYRHNLSNHLFHVTFQH